MKRVNEMVISWDNNVFDIDGVEFKGFQATSDELNELKKIGITDNEPCGRQMCYKGWVWVLIDDPNGNGCIWYKTNARCNE